MKEGASASMGLPAQGDAVSIHPLVRKLGIRKRVAWHTIPGTYITLLTGNAEDVKIVQELLRYSSSRATLDIHAQARMQDKRRPHPEDRDQSSPAAEKRAQSRLGYVSDRVSEDASLRSSTRREVAPAKGWLSMKSFILLASPTGFEPVLSP